VGIEGRLKKIIANLKGIKLSLIYGSCASGKEQVSSDIDLLIIGNPNEDKLLREIESAEKWLGREINYNIYPLKEFKARVERGDNFIINILKRPKIILKGKINGL
jgi:predicted nucleotidyltransferase